MSRPFNPNEPARQPDYQRTYRKITRRQEELDDGLSALYKIINKLRDRVTKLEEKMRCRQMKN